MATLTLSIDGPTLDLAVSLNIADTDAPRIVAWLMSPASGFGLTTETVEHEGASHSVIRPATAEEAVKSCAHSMLDNLLISTVSWEKFQATEAALKSITPIASTLGQ